MSLVDTIFPSVDTILSDLSRHSLESNRNLSTGSRIHKVNLTGKRLGFLIIVRLVNGILPNPLSGANPVVLAFNILISLDGIGNLIFIGTGTITGFLRIFKGKSEVRIDALEGLLRHAQSGVDILHIEAQSITLAGENPRPEVDILIEVLRFDVELNVSDLSVLLVIIDKVSTDDRSEIHSIEAGRNVGTFKLDIVDSAERPILDIDKFELPVEVELGRIDDLALFFAFSGNVSLSDRQEIKRSVGNQGSIAGLNVEFFKIDLEVGDTSLSVLGGNAGDLFEGATIVVVLLLSRLGDTEIVELLGEDRSIVGSVSLGLTLKRKPPKPP